MASSWHLMLTTAPARTLHYLRVYWRADTPSPRSSCPWSSTVASTGLYRCAPAHTLRKSSLQTITLGQRRARFRRGCVAWEPYRTIALPRQRIRGDRNTGHAHGRRYARPTCCDPHCDIGWALPRRRP